MRGKILGIALGAVAAFALWPSFIWLLAQFGWIGDRWFATGGAVQYTFPIALGLAAVIFALHGMLTNSALADELEEQYAATPTLADVPAEARIPVGATVSSGSAAAPAAADPTVEMSVEAAAGEGAEQEKPKLGGKMAVAPRPEGFKAEKGKKGRQPKMKKVGKQVGRRAGYKAKNSVVRGIRERLGLRF